MIDYCKNSVYNFFMPKWTREEIELMFCNKNEFESLFSKDGRVTNLQEAHDEFKLALKTVNPIFKKKVDFFSSRNPKSPNSI